MTIIVPFICLVFYGNKGTGVVFCLILILLNVGVNMLYSYEYNLRIGMLVYNNYYLL